MNPIKGRKPYPKLGLGLRPSVFAPSTPSLMTPTMSKDALRCPNNYTAAPKLKPSQV